VDVVVVVAVSEAIEVEGGSYRGFPLPMMATYKLAPNAHMLCAVKPMHHSYNRKAHLPVYCVMGLSLGVVVVVVKNRGFTIVEKYNGGRTCFAKHLANHGLGNCTCSGPQSAASTSSEVNMYYLKAYKRNRLSISDFPYLLRV
jgi:hypothetical protein